LNQSTGILVQDLPFAIELKKFVVEHYSTGMPKLFASDIVIHDLKTGVAIPQRVEVNHPASYQGIEIYQSSFDDGGSLVKLLATPMTPGGKPFNIEGVIGSSAELARQDSGSQEKLTLEYTGLRVINVENFAGGSGSAVDVRKVDLRESIESRLGAANKVGGKKELRNVGPSVGYKLRDAAGQAREYNNYMLPVDMGDGAPVFLLGMRDSPSEAFRYLRVPADEQGSLAGFARLRAALGNPRARDEAVRRYVARAADPKKPELAEQLTLSTGRALALFAGAMDAKSGDAATAATSAAATSSAGSAAAPVTGLQAVSDFLENRVPATERERAGEVLVRLLNGVMLELVQLDREQAQLKSLPEDEKTFAMTAQMLLALSDAGFYPAPLVFSLQDFTQVQASVFQVARAPGKYIVYLGCAFLIVGIFAMLYVRERRLWIWVTPTGLANDVVSSGAMMALSTNRKTMDSEREFAHLKAKLLGYNLTGS
jgi:cytochrome c biogenesis protein